MTTDADLGWRVYDKIMTISIPDASLLLSEYFQRDTNEHRVYTGSAFDPMDPEWRPNEIAAVDLVAAACLAVPLYGPAVLHILEYHKDRIQELLQQIPADQAITDTDAGFEGTYGEASPLLELWRLLRGTTDGVPVGLGHVRVSKILARKRPWLVPIQDSVVMGWLDVSDRDFWWAWWHAMRVGADSSSEETLSVWAERIRTKTIREADKTGLSSEAVGEIERLSHLRLLDIVIWMRGKQENPFADVVDESSS